MSLHHLLRAVDRARTANPGRPGSRSSMRSSRQGESLDVETLRERRMRAGVASLLESRSRFDVVARHLLQPRDDLAPARRHVESKQRDFLHTAVAVALEVVGADRVRVWTDGELDFRARATVRAEELLDAPDLRLGLIGAQIESDPPIAVFRDTLQRRAAFAAE